MLLKTQIQNIIWSLQTQPFIILKSSLFLAWKSTLCDIYMAVSACFTLLFKFLVSTCISIKYVSWKQNLDLLYDHLDTIIAFFIEACVPYI